MGLGACLDLQRDEDEAMEKREGTSEGDVEGLDWAVIQCGCWFWLLIGGATLALKEGFLMKLCSTRSSAGSSCQRTRSWN
ncbi:hypothetical protein U1Q18_050129 [Sarracenia purpurea var. burkii]